VSMQQLSISCFAAKVSHPSDPDIPKKKSRHENSDLWLEIQVRKLPPTQLKILELVSKYGRPQRMQQLLRQI
jgi:hypothetical protein